MTRYRCPKCERTCEVCSPNAQVVHLCEKAGPRPTMTTFEIEQTEAPALSR